MMYFVTKHTIIIENQIIEEFRIADSDFEYCFFTQDKEKAQSVAAILNENTVEPNHVLDIIEDMFYT